MFSRGYEPLVGGRQAGRELPSECVDALLRLLSIPLRSLGLGVLGLAEYIDLLHFLPWESQKQVCSCGSGVAVSEVGRQGRLGWGGRGGGEP